MKRTTVTLPADALRSKFKKQKLDLKPKNDVEDTFLNQNAAMIKSMYLQGSKPAAIAEALRAKYSLRQNAIVGRQISSWLDYRKKTGQLNNYPVSLANQNLRADGRDSCRIIYY